LVELGHAFDLHIAMLELQLFVLLKQDGTYEADDAISLGKMPTTSARRFTSLSSRSSVSGVFSPRLSRA
jgi:hypothetical protein